MATGGDRSQEVKYIYELPYTERKTLCNILDVNNEWEKLGGHYMGFKVHELHEFRRAEKCGDSPADKLFERWGQQNHTVSELYLLLYRMQHFQAMKTLLPFIAPKHHSLVLRAETSLTSVWKADTSTTDSFGNTRQTLAASSKVKENSSVKLFGLSGTATPLQTQLAVNLDTCGPPSPLVGNPKVPDALLEMRPLAIDTSVGDRLTECQRDDDSKIINLGFSTTTESREDNASRVNYNFDAEYLQRLEAKRAEAFASLSVNDARVPDVVVNTASIGNIISSGSVVASHCLEKNSSQNIGISLPILQSHSIGATSVSLADQGAAAVPLLQQTARNRRSSNTSDLSILSDCSVPMIAYQELEAATNSWAGDNLLGRGGFGSVYRGVWKNTQVAVKRIDIHVDAGLGSIPLHISQSFDELRLLQSYRHDNILQLFGFSADPEQPPCLVYQFMPNGSVEDRLQCRRIAAFAEVSASLPLTWAQRLVIARGTAGALQFLHTVKEKPLIHGDVKSANILLDQNYEPKLGDFGLAREGQSQSTSMKVSRVHGTKPYLPEEYLRQKKLSVRVDAFSYGIVLLELCTGQRAYDDKRQCKFLKELVEETTDRETLRDRKASLEDREVFDWLHQIAIECIDRISKRRPNMATVFGNLEKLGQNIITRVKKNSLGESGSYASLHLSPHWLYPYPETGRSLLTHSAAPISQASYGYAASYVPPGITFSAPRSPYYGMSPVPQAGPVSPRSTGYAYPGQHYGYMMGTNGQQYLVVPSAVSPQPHRVSPSFGRSVGPMSPLTVGVGGHLGTVYSNLVTGHSPIMPLPQLTPHINVSLAGSGVNGSEPPSYSEAISLGGIVGGAGQRVSSVPPLIPELSELSISESSRLDSDSSESSDSDSGKGATSYPAYTMPAYPTGNAVMPGDMQAISHISSHLHRENEIGMPLITELGMMSLCEENVKENVLVKEENGNQNKNVVTAQGKTSIFDDM